MDLYRIVKTPPRGATAALFTLLIVAAAHASPASAESNVYLDVRYPFYGVRVPAPAGVHIAGMHPLRQNWAVAATVKDIAPADLSFLGSSSVITASGGAGADANLCKSTDPTTNQTLWRVTDQNRLACEQLLSNDLAAVHSTVVRLKNAETDLVTGIDAILSRNPDLRSERTLSSYKRDINGCVFGSGSASCPSRMPAIPDIRTLVFQLRNLTETLRADTEQIQLRSAQLQSTQTFKSELAAIRIQDSEETEIAKLVDFYGTTLAPLTMSRFVFEPDPDRCAGLFNHGRETQLVMTLQTNDTRDVTLVCQPPVFVSIGFGGDGINNRTFTTVPANTAGQPAPAAGATPVPSTIAESGGGSRALAVTLANLQLGTSPLYYSLGIGAAVFGGSAGKVDLLTGLSWSDRRTTVITAGFAYGRSQVLAPGYVTGGPIAPGATPPTLNRNSTAFFAGITFAK